MNGAFPKSVSRFGYLITVADGFLADLNLLPQSITDNAKCRDLLDGGATRPLRERGCGRS